MLVLDNDMASYKSMINLFIAFILDRVYKLPSFSLSWILFGDAGWSSSVARQAHNLKVVGSNPTPATNLRFNNRSNSNVGRFFNA